MLGWTPATTLEELVVHDTEEARKEAILRLKVAPVVLAGAAARL